ncbi:hypothetical protein RF11_10262 [Thelohanellus kitauei]|uniref:Uncharacterized protein n=1 Tax=Thelohanellus kitauei TaxID=669202 RepID=A0A0C2JRY7_THEKT|nr:hypothetical protein RF11_10262 [Thelohanellus kitauei]
MEKSKVRKLAFRKPDVNIKTLTSESKKAPPNSHNFVKVRGRIVFCNHCGYLIYTPAQSLFRCKSAFIRDQIASKASMETVCNGYHLHVRPQLKEKRMILENY